MSSYRLAVSERERESELVYMHVKSELCSVFLFLSCFA